MAHRRLGMVLLNRGEDEARMRESMRRAYELRHRLTGVERYHTVATYHAFVTNDLDRTIDAYLNLLDLSPYDGTALNNLAVAYFVRGDFGRAEEFNSRAIGADSSSASPARNIIPAQFSLGKFEAASESYERLVRRFPDHPEALWFPDLFAYAKGDYQGTIAAAEAALATAGDNPASRLTTLNALSARATTRGRLTEAERYREEAARLDERRRGRAASRLSPRRSFTTSSCATMQTGHGHVWRPPWSGTREGPFGWGLGWLVDDQSPHPFVTMMGAGSGAFRHFVNADLTVVVLTNLQGANQFGLVQGVASIYLR